LQKPHLTVFEIARLDFFSASFLFLFAHQFEFRVTVSGAGNRTATSAPVRLTRRFVPAPIVSISLSVPTQGASFTVITAADRVALSAAVASADPAAPALPAYALQWTCTSANVNMTAGSPALLSAPTSRNLVLAENTLAPGQLYAFTLQLINLENAAHSASASVSFRTAGIPNAGVCTASPSTGVALIDTIALVCQNWQDDVANYPLAYQFQSVSSSASASAVTLQDFSASSSLSAFLSAGASVRVTVRNRWGGLSAPFVIQLNVTNPVIQNASALTAAADIALDAMTRAAGSGDVNAASQAAAPLLSLLAGIAARNATAAAAADATNAGGVSGGGGSGGSSVQINREQLTKIRTQLFTASMDIIGSVANQSSSPSSSSSSSSSSATTGSMNIGTLAQSAALISAIVATPTTNSPLVAAASSSSSSTAPPPSASCGEISAAVAIGGSAFASSVAASALVASIAPFSNALATDIIRIGSACVAASLTLNSSIDTNSDSTASGSGGASFSFQREQQLAVGAAVSSATESVARGLLIGALVGQQPPAVSAGLIALTASRRGVDATTGLVQGDLAFALPSASNGEAGNDGSAGSSGTGPSLSSSMAGAGLIGVQVPPSVLADSLGSSSGAAVVDATLVTFSSDIYALSASSSAAAGNAGSDKDNSKRSLPSSAPVVSFTLYDGGAARNGAGANALPIRNLKSSAPVLITIPRGANELNRSDTQCQYWNTVLPLCWHCAPGIF
jgi:hypothetical protein